jgi:hypothetical protein
MKKTLAIAALAFVPALSPAQGPAADPLAYLGWMKDLAGACWEGKDDRGRVTDRQCYELQFGRFLRGTIEIGAADGKPAGFRGDSLFHRDPKTGRVAIVLWASTGSVSLSEAVVEGEAIRYLQPKAEGRPESRTSWTRQGADGFRVAREHREGKAWQETLVVNYRRVPR